MTRTVNSLTLCTVISLLVIACGPPVRRGPPDLSHKPPPDANLKASDPSRLSVMDDDMQISGTWGTLSEYDIQQVMQANMSGFNNCFRRAAGRFVSGRVDTRFLIAADGRVDQVFIARSNLGSWRVEDCIVQTARFFEFPPPEGGPRAKFDYPFTWNLSAVRLTRPVNEAWGYPTLRKHRRQFQRCRRAHNFEAPFRLTVYVGRKGKPLSVGFDADEAPGDGFAGCVVQLVEDMKFPNPGQRSVKYQALVEDLPDA